MALPPIPPEILAQAANWAKKGIITVVAPNRRQVGLHRGTTSG